MTYQDALDYIHGRPRPQVRMDGHISLARFRQLMARLGDPQKGLKIVHIAGSSGKGSTATLTEAVLRAAGYRTGLFVSPYVLDFRERIQLDGAIVGEDTLAAAVEALMPHVSAMEAEGVPCTEFDIVTALALMIFRAQSVDIVCLEVGIGGLTDRTNVIDSPEVAAICSISLEHTDILGSTLAEIAAQKCGIIKPGCRVAAYGALSAEALTVLEDTCAHLDIKPHIADTQQLELLAMDPDGSDFRYRGTDYRVSLAGEHQVMNALTALTITDALRDAGWRIPEEAVRRGLASTHFVGRMQTVGEGPRCIIDGAHNPEKIDSLCRALDRLYPGRRLIAVMGMKADKDYLYCIPEIARRSAVFIAATPRQMPRALPASETARIASAHCAEVYIRDSAREAGALAIQLAGPDDLVLACGSLYIIGEAREGFLASTD